MGDSVCKDKSNKGMKQRSTGTPGSRVGDCLVQSAWRHWFIIYLIHISQSSSCINGDNTKGTHLGIAKSIILGTMHQNKICFKTKVEITYINIFKKEDL